MYEDVCKKNKSFAIQTHKILPIYEFTKKIWKNYDVLSLWFLASYVHVDANMEVVAHRIGCEMVDATPNGHRIFFAANLPTTHCFVQTCSVGGFLWWIWVSNFVVCVFLSSKRNVKWQDTTSHTWVGFENPMDENGEFVETSQVVQRFHNRCLVYMSLQHDIRVQRAPKKQRSHGFSVARFSTETCLW